MAVRKIKVQGVSDIFVDEGGGGGGATVYADRAAFPAAPAANATQLFAIATDTGLLYCSFNGGWCPIVELVPDGL